MCGIAGIWMKSRPVGPPELADVAAMSSALAHRGPDGSGAWHCGHVAFGHRRLSIIDPSPAAAQPMLTPRGDGALVYNGEVYNFRELRESLVREGIAFRTQSDSEVVLAALHHWGPEQAVPRFDGMFALAYFDVRMARLWLARDRLGIKPLSIAETADRIVFASEDKAILACSGFTHDVDSREITLRLAWQWRDAAASLFGGIERLSPGNLWKISDGSVERTCYWHALDALDTRRMMAGGMSDVRRVAALEGALVDSVTKHCVADTALATACSGGIDSGLITMLARQSRPDMHAYVVDPELGTSEVESAERTAAKAGVEIRRVPLGTQRFLELWPKMVWHLESDGWGGSWPAMLALSQQCRADGVKVLLTGEGADELFGGYSWQRDSMQKWRFLSWPWSLFRSRKAMARKIARARTAPFPQSMGRSSPFERQVVLQSLSPEANILQTRIFDRLDGVEPLSDRAFLACCLFDLYSHLQELLHRHDRLSMASSVELRVPFLENRLIDFALHLPRRLKYRHKTGKWLLKKVAERHLPLENVRAGKIGFEISGEMSMGAEELLRRGMLRDVLRWPADYVGDMVELAAQSEPPRMRLVGMELFLRLHLAGETPQQLSELLMESSSQIGNPGTKRLPLRQSPMAAPLRAPPAPRQSECVKYVTSRTGRSLC